MKLEMENKSLNNDGYYCPRCDSTLYYNKHWELWVCQNKYCCFPGYKVIRRDPWEKVRKR
jgi:hypothetical protein